MSQKTWRAIVIVPPPAGAGFSLWTRFYGTDIFVHNVPVMKTALVVAAMVIWEMAR